jgi:diguanylate cyclase (GGDEF)-like protein
MPLYVKNPSSKYSKDKILRRDELIQLLKRERYARKKAEELSEIDDITELLLNRRGWKKYAKSTAFKLIKQNAPFTIFFIDLDRLKAVDDLFTNQHGTVYIQIFAEVLHSTLRSSDVISHPQGDEYFVMLPNTSLKEAKALRKKVEENFKNVIETLPPEHYFYEVPIKCEVGASIGIAHRKWRAVEREKILKTTKDEAEKLLGAIIKEVRLKANADSNKIKKRKRVKRDEARKLGRIRYYSSKIPLLRTLGAY